MEEKRFPEEIPEEIDEIIEDKKYLEEIDDETLAYLWWKWLVFNARRGIYHYISLGTKKEEKDDRAV